jgi:putative oxidoreductase
MSPIVFDVATGYPQRLNIGLAVLRIVTGFVFFMHGWQKVFTFGFGGISQGFGQMGVPVPGVTGPLVALVELLGGLALIIGLLTRLAAIGTSVVMIGAIFMVHLAAGFFLPNGYEFALTLLGVSIAIVLMGAGEYSVDGAIAKRRTVATAAY